MKKKFMSVCSYILLSAGLILYILLLFQGKGTDWGTIFVPVILICILAANLLSMLSSEMK